MILSSPRDDAPITGERIALGIELRFLRDQDISLFHLRFRAVGQLLEPGLCVGVVDRLLLLGAHHEGL